MKKIVLRLFALVLPPVFFVFSCNLDPSPSPQQDEGVRSSPGGEPVVEQQYYTVYLEPENVIGINTNANTRAMSKEIAVMWHEFFEVVFKYNDGSTDGIVARASWEKGNPTGVSGLYRGNGIDYSAAISPAPNSGSAVLFVGTKNDRTLLGVGRLIDVRDRNGNSTGTIINNNSVSVTFEVSALKAGVNYDKTLSSFITNSGGNAVLPGNTTLVNNIIYVQNKYFPLFKLTSTVINATYEFYIDGGSWSTFKNAIILADNNGAKCGKRIPRYHIGNGQYQFGSHLLVDENTIESITNNLSAGDIFENPVEFSFNTANTEDGSVFALVFEIPVYPLSGVGNSGKWYIRPSHGSYLFDLDDGIGGVGGAVFIGTGNVESYLPQQYSPPLPPPSYWPP